MNDGPPLLGLLRAATASVHEHLHRHDFMRAVTAGGLDRDNYAQLLTAFWAPWVALERWCEAQPAEWHTRVPGRRIDIETDLRTLGFTVPAARVADLPSDAAALGYAYTLVGSSMGAPSLRAGVLRAQPDAPTCFLSRSPKESGWPYLAQLLRRPRAHADVDATVDGAIAAFRHVEAGLNAG